MTLMDLGAILAAFNNHSVDYLLIGGMNFMLNHAPYLTYDVDLWVADNTENLRCCNLALLTLKAEWGPNDDTWAAVPENPAWLGRQAIFCLTSPHGAIDIFRDVRGLEGKFADCAQRAPARKTDTGISYRGLSDEDMLRCQEALDPAEQKLDRIRVLRAVLASKGAS